MLKKIIIISVVLIYCCSCSTEFNSKEHVLINFKNKKQLASIKCQIKSEDIGELVDLKVLDSVLIINEMFSPKIYKLFNLNTGELIVSAINKGRGPNEQTMPNLLYSYNNKAITTYARTRREVIQLNIENALYGDIFFKKTIKVHPYTLQAYPINDSIFVATGVFDNGRYCLTNTRSETSSVMGDYPKLKNNVPDNMKGLIFQSEISIKPDKKKFVCVCNNQSIIEICSVNGDEIKSEQLKIYKIPEVTIENGHPMNPKDSKFAFHSVSSNNKRIFVIYSGRTYLEFGEYRYGGDNLLVYNWNAKPLIHYKLDRYLLRAALNHSTNMLYGYTVDPETGKPEIVSYKL